jgi:hypothetical protein
MVRRTMRFESGLDGVDQYFLETMVSVCRLRQLSQIESLLTATLLKKKYGKSRHMAVDSSRYAAPVE